VTLAKSVSVELCGSYGAVLSGMKQGATGPRMGDWRTLVFEHIRDHNLVGAGEGKRQKGFVPLPA